MSPRAQALTRALVALRPLSFDQKELLADLLIAMIADESGESGCSVDARTKYLWAVEIIRMKPPMEVLRALGL